MQLRFKTALNSWEYVSQQAWRGVSLERCPLHPNGGCSFARHGTYARVEPPGTRIPRWYCPEGHCTFSLLADCFASRLSGSLTELERVVVEAEQAKSLEAAADCLRTDDISLPGRFAGRGAASDRCIPCSGSCSISSRNASAVASRPSPRFANGSVWSGSFRTRGKWPTSTSVCCRRRLVLRPLVQPAITADEFNMTRGQTRRRISVKFSSIVFP